MTNTCETTTTFEEIHEDPQLPMVIRMSQYPPRTGGYCMNWHANMEILYILEGNCTIFCDSHHFPVKKGDVIIINSNDIHMVYTHDSSCDYLYLIPGLNLCDHLSMNVRNTRFMNKPQDDFIGATLLDIYQELIDEKLLYKASMTSKLVNLLVYIYRNYSLPEQQAEEKVKHHQKQEALKIALKYIRDHFEHNITLDGLCHELGFNKYYFCHLFKELTNQTVFSYINSLRCEQARSLLYTGRYTIAEVADLCGFCSASYFTKQYKKYMNCLPSESLRNKSERT